MPLTREQKRKYLQGGGTHCPYCGSDQLDADGITDMDEATERVRCLTCKKEWHDDYKIVAIREIEEGDDDA